MIRSYAKKKPKNAWNKEAAAATVAANLVSKLVTNAEVKKEEG